MDSEELREGVVLDYGADGALVGIDVQRAAAVDLRELQAGIREYRGKLDWQGDLDAMRGG